MIVAGHGHPAPARFFCLVWRGLAGVAATALRSVLQASYKSLGLELSALDPSCRFTSAAAVPAATAGGRRAAPGLVHFQQGVSAAGCGALAGLELSWQV